MHCWAPPEYATFPQQLELLSSPGQNCHTTAQWPQQGHYVMIRPHLSYCAATQGGANHQCWSLQSLSSKEPNHKLGDSVFLDRGGSEWYMKSLLSRKSLSQFVPGMFALTSWISLSVFCIVPGSQGWMKVSIDFVQVAIDCPAAGRRITDYWLWAVVTGHRSSVAPACTHVFDIKNIWKIVCFSCFRWKT